MFRIMVARKTVGTVAAVAALMGTAILGGTGTANATPADDGIFFACPDLAPFATITTVTCQKLPAAIAAAETWNNTSRTTATIDLLPGKYCPVSLPYDPYAITIQGLGLAGLKNASAASSYTGFETDLSEFTDIAGTCSGSPAAFITNLPNPEEPTEIWGDLGFQNFAINGANGVSDGIDVTNASLGARDLLVENLSGNGIHWQDNVNFYNGDVDNSAFISNGIGTHVSTGGNHGFAVDESTYAGNSIGISGAGNVSIGGDTIAHNGTGLSGTFGQVVESIVGDNTTANCSTNAYQDFGDNLYGPGSCTTTTGDKTLTSTLAAASTSGPAITPSITPPSEAAGLVSGGTCVATQDNVDQEEQSTSGLTSCDAGSIQPSGTTGAPVADPSPQDFGAVPTNEPATASVYLESAGGLTDVTGVSVATTSGTGHFALSSTTCEYFLLYKQFDSGNCHASISATAVNSSGVTNGTVTFHTGSGDIVEDLKLTGAPAITAPAAPTDLAGTARSHEVDLSWNLTPTADDGGQAIQYYEVDDSTDGGKTWNQIDTQYDTTDNPAAVSINDNITNNKEYEFRVIANNGVLNSAPSKTITLTPEGAATSLASPTKATIVAGTSEAIHTTLTSSGKPVPNVAVHLQREAAGTTAWTAAGSATTAVNGTASVTVTPTSNAAYRWAFTGNDTYAPSNSSSGTIQVDQLVRVHYTPVVKAGHLDPFYGTVSPAVSGKTVTLQRLIHGKWKTVGHTTIKKQTLPHAKKKSLGYLIDYRPATKGKQTLRVSRAKTSTNAAGVSKALTLTVK